MTDIPTQYVHTLHIRVPTFSVLTWDSLLDLTSNAKIVTGSPVPCKTKMSEWSDVQVKSLSTKGKISNQNKI